MAGRFEALRTAIQENDCEAAREILRKSPAVATEHDDAGQSALHFAAYQGGAEIVDLLLASGATVDARTVVGYSPLHYAAFAGQAEAFERLLEAGADIHAVDDSLTTVLHAAAVGGNRAIVDRTLAAGISPGVLNRYDESPNHRAAQRDRLAIVQHLITQGADPRPIDRYDLGLLHKAAIGGAVETTEWLLANGHDPEALNLPGETPLHTAAEAGRVETVRTLIDRGATIDSRTHEQATPLHVAAAGGHAAVVELLLSHDADPKAADLLGRTPLHTAAIRGQTDVVRLLLDLGIDPLKTDVEGWTPVDLATAYGHPETRELLSERTGVPGWIDPSAAEDLPTRTVPHGEMIVWYLGHSGWAIRTTSHWLIVDYAPGAPDRDDASLLNGRIRIEQLGDAPAFVFVSHHHNDHFDRRILSRSDRPATEFVFGWDAPSDLPGSRFAGRSEQQIGEALVRSIPATDAGSAFLIEIDGLCIYHAGDHTAQEVPPESAFTEGIDWLASHGTAIDAAFLPVFGCGLPETEPLREGNRYTIDRLRPRVVFPMHVGWTGYFYRSFESWAKATGIETPLGIADQPGDRFHVSASTVRKLWT